ncbi:tetratricopeptide repeat protein, partial [Acinetobacter baumannii]
QWMEAIGASERAYSIIHGVLGDRNRATLGTYANMGALYLLAGQHDTGVQILTQAHDGLPQLLGTADPSTPDNDFYLAYALAGAGRL